MLTTVKTLKNYALNGIDGKIGTVKEFYFDDHYWTIRYLVADTGHWLPGRQVLLSPHALGAVNEEKRQVAVALTKKKIADSPSLDSDKPVSRQFEDSFYGYYGWPRYWSGPFMWGPLPGLVRDSERIWDLPRPKDAWNPHLRSTHEVSGYHIHASDGDIGHVADYIVDDEAWAIRYLIVDTQNWWPGKKVLISPQWIKRVSWGESKVFVDLSRALIRKSPEYTKWSLFNRDYEKVLHKHYRRQGYWVEEPVAHEHSR